MKIAIYYFSATGNSLFVARDLAASLGDTDIIAITRALHSGGVAAYETVGIVFPVYMFGLPLIVAKFLKEAEIKPDAYIFTVATLGGLPGKCHTQARNILRARGKELSAGFSVLMPGNYTPLYGAIPEERQQKMFFKEKERIRTIADSVRGRKKGIIEEKPFLPNFLLNALLYRKGSKQIPASAKGFWATDACTRCGLCARVCPVENIELRDGRPVWLDHCEHCMACLQWCPVEAIQYKKSTIGKKRYHHPEITAEDICSQRV